MIGRESPAPTGHDAHDDQHTRYCGTVTRPNCDDAMPQTGFAGSRWHPRPVRISVPAPRARDNR
ncbi:hypothetical protein CcI156_02110 [Frankia sp. CcI156]|nr:hypothetical protein CgIS1_04840 [Frankia sp. CgIS1]ONH29659.1 hypothetical protein CcI156_02110 [Frankia sp. CcI156]ORT52369.1 hypothetical protein KBI5_09910 [Frankia sp. KB5]